MSLDKLADKIAENAKSEADSIVEGAKAEAKNIKSTAKKEASTIVDQLKQNAEQEADQLGTEMSAAARQHNQKRMLIAKREELDSTWQAVQDVVAQAGMKGRVSVLKALITSAAKEGTSKMILRPVAIDRKVLEDIGSKYSIGSDIEGLGGFILESDGGAVSLDYRFESRLEEAWNNNLATITETLFS